MYNWITSVGCEPWWGEDVCSQGQDGQIPPEACDAKTVQPKRDWCCQRKVGRRRRRSLRRHHGLLLCSSCQPWSCFRTRFCWPTCWAGGKLHSADVFFFKKIINPQVESGEVDPELSSNTTGLNIEQALSAAFTVLWWPQCLLCPSSSIWGLHKNAGSSNWGEGGVPEEGRPLHAGS